MIRLRFASTLAEIPTTGAPWRSDFKAVAATLNAWYGPEYDPPFAHAPTHDDLRASAAAERFNGEIVLREIDDSVPPGANP